jgi:CHRD domain
VKLRYLLLAALVGALATVGVTTAIGARTGDPGTFFAVALGKKEVSPTTGKKGAGDPNGRAGFTAVIRNTDGPDSAFCFGYAVKSVGGTPSGAHIHRGRPTVNGPILINLADGLGDSGLPDSALAGAGSGCETITDDLAQAIKRNPNKYYFNLHTTPDFASGAVRGQVFGKRR